MELKRPLIHIVESAPRFTGSVRSISSVVRALKPRFDFALVGQSEVVRDALDVPWHRFEFPMPRRSEVLSFGPRVMLQAIRFLRLARATRPDIVHVNDLTNVVPIVARWIGATYRLVYHVRLLPTSYIGPIYGPLSRLVLANADRVVCVSQAVVDALPHSGRVSLVPNGLPVAVIPDGIVVDALDRLVEPTRDIDFVNVLYLGHFHPGKGHEHAVRAFALAFSRAPNLRLSFVGSEDVDPAYARSVRTLAEELHLQGAVSFLGPVKDPSSAIRAADIVLNLSESESFSMVVLESMMSGRAIIASRCGGPNELLSAPGSGLLVENRDVHGAADALVHFATDALARRAAGEKARAIAIERYDVQRTAQLLANVYDSLR